ncbi:MAG TPA: hypothetical protein K8U92_02800 [Aliarcobacter thereius]|nr:hypothetical protein [Aliarcobacter thereius]HJE02780.1 hypothetical protein [Aliarcobacter thereius]
MEIIKYNPGDIKEITMLLEKNELLEMVDFQIESLNNLKKQIKNKDEYLNSNNQENYLYCDSLLRKDFRKLFVKILSNNFWFDYIDFGNQLFKLFYLVQNSNFFIIIDENPLKIEEITEEGASREVLLFKASKLKSHLHDVINKMIHNTSTLLSSSYYQEILKANILFLIEKVENKNTELEEIIKSYYSDSSVAYICNLINSHVDLSSDNKIALNHRLYISLYTSIVSIRKEIDEMHEKHIYYNQTDNCFAKLLKGKKRYKNTKPVG